MGGAVGWVDRRVTVTAGGRRIVLGIACGQRAVNVQSTGQTLRVPARVVMLGPPYPLISPMSRVRI